MVDKYNTIIIPYGILNEDFGFDEEPDDDELYEVEAIGYTADGKQVLVRVEMYDGSGEFFTDVDMDKQIEGSGLMMRDFIDEDGNRFDSDDSKWSQGTYWVYIYDIEYWEELCKKAE